MSRPATPRLLPREHGAYAQLAFPLLSVLIAAHWNLPVVGFAVATVALFFAHEPVLILLGCVLVILGPRISARVAARADARGGMAEHGAWWVWPAVTLAGVYGGYFGAALGVMLVAGLALVLDAILARVSAIKNLLSALVGLTTLVVFALFGPVNWTAVAVVAPATLIGGYAGARLVRRLPPALLKGLIVVFGTTIGLYLLWRALR